MMNTFDNSHLQIHHHFIPTLISSMCYKLSTCYCYINKYILKNLIALPVKDTRLQSCNLVSPLEWNANISGRDCLATEK